MPATSQQQFKYMQGICHGTIDPPKGMTREKACEYIAGQSPKGLPKRKVAKVKWYKK